MFFIIFFHGKGHLFLWTYRTHLCKATGNLDQNWLLNHDLAQFFLPFNLTWTVILGRRVRNILESHLSRSAKNFAIRRPIFKLRYLSNQCGYKKGTYIFWKFRILSFIWLWFHAIISICLQSAQFWKKFPKLWDFSTCRNYTFSAYFVILKKMLDFERL